MRISELIAQLEAVYAEHGDLPIVIVSASGDLNQYEFHPSVAVETNTGIFQVRERDEEDRWVFIYGAM